MQRTSVPTRTRPTDGISRRACGVLREWVRSGALREETREHGGERQQKRQTAGMDHPAGHGPPPRAVPASTPIRHIHDNNVLELAWQISCASDGSIQTLRLPQDIMLAASLFCSLTDTIFYLSYSSTQVFDVVRRRGAWSPFSGRGHGARPSRPLVGYRPLSLKGETSLGS